jgi:hypothetical protein
MPVRIWSFSCRPGEKEVVQPWKLTKSSKTTYRFACDASKVKFVAFRQ